MPRNRFECKNDSPGKWSVTDALTGRVCEVGYRKVSGLCEDDAIEMKVLLEANPVAVTSCPARDIHSEFQRIADAI